MQRVHCPRHREKTPSVVIYSDHAFCYGGCGLIPLSELGLRGSEPSVVLPPTDLKSELERIQALPRASVRGCKLPVDSDSYYIVWPGNDYFKRRKFLPGDGPKYICPRGHKKPLFVPLVQPGAKTLAVVEGELNALSIASLSPPFSVCSPGGVGDMKKFFDNCKALCLTYTNFLCIVDRDEPGLDAAVALKKQLLSITPHIRIVLMAKDANEQLQAGELEREVQEWTSGSAFTNATKPQR